MNYIILLFGFFLLISTGCANDNRVSTRYTITRVIKNSSDHLIQLRHYFEINHLDTLLHPGDSVALSANCVVTGGELGCFNPAYSYAFAQALEDSVQIIFNNARIIRFIESEIGSCCSKNILVMEPQWGYKVSGVGTGIETYTYEITNEDYEIAEPYSDGD